MWSEGPARRDRVIAPRTRRRPSSLCTATSSIVAACSNLAPCSYAQSRMTADTRELPPKFATIKIEPRLESALRDI